MRCGLIGEKLGHSFSGEIHGKLGRYDYSLIELRPDEVERFINSRAFDGLNVTIPYKQAVIPYLDQISDLAERIGAVNTIVNSGGRLIGGNTDYGGMKMLIERLGGILKFNDAADKIFRSNLCMIDLHFPRVLGEMCRAMHLEGITKVSELTEYIKQLNPLKIKDELINKHKYYEYKMKQFLMTLALGMRPAKLFNGTDSAIAGFLMMDAQGEVIAYQKADRDAFAEFLYKNTRLEKGSTNKDKYGYLEKENGVYYFKLNLKIGLVKR